MSASVEPSTKVLSLLTNCTGAGDANELWWRVVDASDELSERLAGHTSPEAASREPNEDGWDPAALCYFANAFTLARRTGARLVSLEHVIHSLLEDPPPVARPILDAIPDDVTAMLRKPFAASTPSRALSQVPSASEVSIEGHLADAFLEATSALSLMTGLASHSPEVRQALAADPMHPRTGASDDLDAPGDLLDVLGHVGQRVLSEGRTTATPRDMLEALAALSGEPARRLAEAGFASERLRSLARRVGPDT